MRSLPELTSGAVFAEKYRVERRLATGGMGSVYEVRHVVHHKRYALKLMHPDLALDDEARARFVREAQIDAVIESAYVVSVVDAGVDASTETPFLVMEFLVGEELGDMLRRGQRATPERLVRWLGQVARALDKAHARGIVHRDLKPENLFLTFSDDEGEKIKVLDFGIAKWLEAASQSSTIGGGTPLYMAPEQTRRGREIGPWTDVWALGLIAYVMLVGAPYWRAQTIGELYGELLDPSGREPPSVRAAPLGVALPPAFDAWFFRCVDNDARRRFARATEAVEQLAAALGVPTSLRGFAQPSMPPPVSPIARTELAPTPTPSAIPAVSAAGASMPDTHAYGASWGAPPAPRMPAPIPIAPSSTAAPLSRTGTAQPPASRAPLVLVFAIASVVALVGVGVGLFAMHSMMQKPPPPATPSAPAKSARAVAVAPSKHVEPRPSLRETIEKMDAFVAIGGFSIQRTEITRAAYASYVASLPERERPGARPLRDWTGEPVEEAYAQRPVTWLPWARARRFCEAIEARLPTPEEFARASGAGGYPWGAAWPPPKLAGVAVARGDAALAVDVATSPLDRTTEGVFDLFGNVAEWTSLEAGGLATARGASIDLSLDDARAAFSRGVQKAADDDAHARERAEELADDTLGFRCAR